MASHGRDTRASDVPAARSGAENVTGPGEPEPARSCVPFRYFGTFFGTLGAKRFALVRLLPAFLAAVRFAGRFAFFAAM